MTIRNDLSRLLSKATQDAGFRARLFREPLAAAACLGIALNAAQVSVIKDFQQRLADAAQTSTSTPSSLARVVIFPQLLPRVSADA